VKIRTIKPSFMVSLSVTTTGGVRYDRTDLTPDRPAETANGAEVRRWETVAITEDPAEHERATKIRTKCRTTISRLCAGSRHGLMCPLDQETSLRAAIDESIAIAAEHNRTAARTRVNVYAIVSRVAADDAQAVRAINAEVRGLLEEMETGIKAANVKQIRDAANAARDLGAVLDPAVSDKVSAAVDEARAAARMIVKRIGDASDKAAIAVADLKIEALTSARSMLDLDDSAPIESLPVVTSAAEVEIPAAPVQVEAARAEIPPSIEF
jgi:hypothetical protein